METALYHFLLVNSYLITLYFIYLGLLRGANNYRFSRPFLVIGTIVSVVLPFLEFASLNIYGSNIQLNQVLKEIVVSQNLDTTVSSLSWPVAIAYGYLMISLFFLLRFGFRLTQLFKIKSNSIKRENYYELPKCIHAFSFLNWIFIGSELTESEKEIVLRHENIHVNRRHSLDILFFQCLEIVFWINPMVFKFKILIQELHEFEADENSCQEEEKYLQLLIKQNINQFPSFLIHSFNSTHLKLRIMRIKKQLKTKINPIAIGISIITFGLLFVSVQNLKASNNGEETVQKEKTEVDKIPEYPGGTEAMTQFILSNTIYPKNVVEKNIQGKVFVEFIVKKDGSLSNYKVLRAAHSELKELAIEVIKKMPNWIPGEKDGKKVAVKMTLPISFVLPPKPPMPPSPPSK